MRLFPSWGKLDWMIYGTLVLLIAILSGGAYSYDHPTAHAGKHNSPSTFASQASKKEHQSAPNLKDDPRYEARDSDAPKVRIVPQLRDGWDIATTAANVFIAFMATFGTIFTGLNILLLKRAIIVSSDQKVAMQETLEAIRVQARIMDQQTKHLSESVKISLISSEITKDQFWAMKSKERARLTIEVFNYELANIPIVNYTLTCHGTTPATIISASCDVAVIPVSDSPWLEDDFYQRKPFDLRSVISTGEFSKYEFILNVKEGIGIEPAESLIKKGKLFIQFRMHIVYSDIFDDEHCCSVSKMFGIKPNKPWAALAAIYSDPIPEWYDSRFGYGEYEK